MATLLTALAAGFAPAQTEVISAPAERAVPMQSLQQLAREVLAHRNSPSARLREVRALRASLVKLGEGLAELDADPTPDHATALLASRQAVQARFAAFRGAAVTAAPASLQGQIEVQMDALWDEVDAAAVDPIGQRSRIVLARQRVEEALDQPGSERGPSIQGVLPTSPAAAK